MRKNISISQQRLREIAWEMGQYVDTAPAGSSVALYMVTPRRAHLHYYLEPAAVEALKVSMGDRFHGARLVLRLYDITDILFDGFNSHGFIDIDVHGLSGSTYRGINRVGRNYLAEVGFRLPDVSFHPLARSAPVFFERERPAGRYQTEGLYVAGNFSHLFPVENIFDAPLFARFHRQMIGAAATSPPPLVAMVCLEIGPEDAGNKPLRQQVAALAGGLKKLGAESVLFSAPLSLPDDPDSDLTAALAPLALELGQRIAQSHAQKPFSAIHCHDWYSAAAGAAAAARCGLPLIITLHSIEYERAGHGTITPLSQAIREEEKKAVASARLVICPHSSTRQEIVNLYGANPEKVVIIADPAADGDSPRQASDPRSACGLPPEGTIALFAGEVSHAAGADILIQAMITICSQAPLYLIIAGNGPLRGELERWTQTSGISKWCRFTGDVSTSHFQELLLAADFVVIPARTWQDEGLAQMALSHGKPVLVTHQAGIGVIAHGRNGLVTYDNPGSIVWGMQELRRNPFQGQMLRAAARQHAEGRPRLDAIAFQHYVHYLQTKGPLKNNLAF